MNYVLLTGDLPRHIRTSGLRAPDRLALLRTFLDLNKTDYFNLEDWTS